MKTYLSPEEQWERTAVLWRADWILGDKPIAPWLRIGVIVRPCRLFLPGDCVRVWVNNGQADRYPVLGVSAKGYEVTNAWMSFQTWKIKPSKFTRYDAGPLRLPGLPDDLVGKRPDDPAARRFVAALRAAYVHARPHGR